MKKERKNTGKKLFIPTVEWRHVHPVMMECASDMYYTQLSSTIATLLKNRIGDKLGFDNDEYKDLGITIAAYLEDKVSNLNIWNSFISLYRKKYDNSYPFYDIDGEEMYDDEPNFSDIRFLLWDSLNQASPDSFINPLTEPIKLLAKEIYELLSEEYETAPETPEMRDYILDIEKYNDVMQIRELCKWVVSSSYMLCSRDIPSHYEELSKNFSLITEGMDEMMKLYFFMNYLVMNTSSGPLDLYPWEYLAEMLELSGEEKLMAKATMLRDIKALSVLPYKALKRETEGVVVKDVKGESITISYDMLTKDAAKDIDRNDVLMTTLYYCNGEWNINGASSIVKSDVAFNGFVKDYKERMKQQKLAKEYYLKKNSGSPIGIEYSFEDFKSKFGLDNIPDKSPEQMSQQMNDAKDILYFINDDGTLSLLPGCGDVVNLPGNALYDKEEAVKKAAQLILNDEASDEMRMYLIDNGLIPDARLSGALPDEEAKAWFKKYASFINCCCHSDSLHFNFP